MNPTDTISEQTKQCLLKTLGLSPTQAIEDTMHLRNDLGMDSMNLLTLLMNLEEQVAHFESDPHSLDDSDFETVATLCHYVADTVEHNTSQHR